MPCSNSASPHPFFHSRKKINWQGLCYESQHFFSQFVPKKVLREWVRCYMCQKRTVRNDSSVPSPPRKRPKMHNSWEGGWVNREEEEEEDEKTITGPFRSLPLIHTARAFVSASVARNSPTLSATFKTTFFPTHNQSIPICRKLFCVWRCFLRHCRMPYLHHLVVTVPATQGQIASCQT